MRASLAMVMLFGCTSATLEYGDIGTPGMDQPTQAQAEPQTSSNCVGTFSGEAEDLTVEIAPAPEDGLAIRLPCIEVPPYESGFYCYFGTYEGPTVGIDYMAMFYSEHSHHNQLMVAKHGDDEHEDGILYDCTDWGSDGSFEPMVADTGLVKEENTVGMPDGFAFKLESGTRYVLEVHYINALEHPIAVNDGANLGLVAEQDVSTWVASYHFDAKVDIPPGMEHTSCLTCEVPQDYGVLSMQGHMHDRGQAFSVDLTRDGSTERIYEVLDWDPAWTENPFEIIEGYEAGTFSFQEEDEITTCCTWVNETEETIAHPQEMCTFMGVVYPLDEPWKCL